MFEADIKDSFANQFTYCDNNPIIREDNNGYYHNINLMTPDTGTASLINEAVVREIEAWKEEKMRFTIDISASVSAFIFGAKGGISIVFDLIGDPTEIYFHVGQSISHGTGVSSSFGVVENYKDIGDYKGTFVDYNVGFGVGVDYAFAPDKPLNETVKSKCVSFPLPIPGIPWFYQDLFSISGGYGRDEYIFLFSF